MHRKLLSVLTRKTFFDLVDHTNAMKHLLELSDRPEIMPWICNFHSDSSQVTKYHDTVSQAQELSCGLPPRHTAWSNCIRGSRQWWIRRNPGPWPEPNWIKTFMWHFHHTAGPQPISRLVRTKQDYAQPNKVQSHVHLFQPQSWHTYDIIHLQPHIWGAVQCQSSLVWHFKPT